MWNNDISACLHNERIVKMLDVDNSRRKIGLSSRLETKSPALALLQLTMHTLHSSVLQTRPKNRTST